MKTGIKGRVSFEMPVFFYNSTFRIIKNEKNQAWNSADSDDVWAQLRSQPDPEHAKDPHLHPQHQHHPVQPPLLPALRHLHPLHHPHGLLLLKNLQ